MRLRRSIAFFLLAAATVSCSSGGVKQGVRVNSLDTNVGLGVEAPLNAAPPNIVARNPIPIAKFKEPAVRTLPPLPTVPPDLSKCKQAGDFDFPDREAPVDPDPNVRPKAGNYPFYLSGAITTDAGKQPIDDFETRVVSESTSDSAAPGAYDFKVKQSELIDERRGSGVTETTYRVVPKGNIQTVPNPPVGPRTSDTGRGVYLVSIEFTGKDERGNETSSQFNPSSPLLLLPFPAGPGAAINASGTDPETGEQLTITGTVKGKKQVDACGHRVDTWFIDGDETYRITDPKTLQTTTIEANYDYGIAPQYGSLVLFEHIDAPKDGPIIQLEARVAKVPEQAKVSS